MRLRYPNRVVTYVTDEQLAGLRGCVAREPYRYPTLSRLLCTIVAEGLAARGVPSRDRRPRAASRLRRVRHG